MNHKTHGSMKDDAEHTMWNEDEMGTNESKRG
jgi:hypothetical protein